MRSSSQKRWLLFTLQLEFDFPPLGDRKTSCEHNIDTFYDDLWTVGYSHLQQLLTICFSLSFNTVLLEVCNIFCAGAQSLGLSWTGQLTQSFTSFILCVVVTLLLILQISLASHHFKAKEAPCNSIIKCNVVVHCEAGSVCCLLVLFVDWVLTSVMHLDSYTYCDLLTSMCMYSQCGYSNLCY